MSRRKQILGVGFLFAAAVSAPATASAQQPAAPAPSVNDYPACPKPLENEEAKKKFIAARQDYEEGSYDSALKRFRDAYALDCKPELLLLISATWERKGDKQQAIFALELFVQRAPKDHPDMTTTQSKIENLKKQSPPPPPPVTPPPPPPQAADPNEHTIYPWLVVGLGVVAIPVGIVLVATAPDVPSNCNEDTGKCTVVPGRESEEQKDRDTAGKAVGQPVVGIVIAAGGAALIAGGLLWHFLEPTGPKDKAKLRPSIAPGFAGLSYTGSF